MSDDLTERLRESGSRSEIELHEDREEAADRIEELGVAYVQADHIEELEAENHLLKTSGIIEVAVRNPNVMEYVRHWEGRAEAAEARIEQIEELYEAAKQDAKEAEAYAEELETQFSEARQVGKEWFEEQKKARKDANAVEAKLAKAVGAGVNVGVSLYAAISLLERGGKKAAPSDKMFNQMLVDYKASLDRLSTTLTELKGETDE